MMTSVINATETIIDKLEEKKMEKEKNGETTKEINEINPNTIDNFSSKGIKLLSFFLKTPLKSLV